MAGSGEAQLPEDVGAALALLLRLQVDVVGLLRVGARSDKDDLGALEIEQAGILGRELAPAELLLQLLGVVGLLLLAQLRGPRPAPPFRVRDRDREARLLRDVERLLHRTGLLRQLERPDEVQLVALAHQGVDALAGRPRRRPHPLGARLGLVGVALQLPLDLPAGVREHLDEAPVTLVPVDVRQALAADVDQAKPAAVRLERDVKVPDVIEVLGRDVLVLAWRAHLWPIDEEDVALLQHLRRFTLVCLLDHRHGPQAQRGAGSATPGPLAGQRSASPAVPEAIAPCAPGWGRPESQPSARVHQTGT